MKSQAREPAPVTGVPSGGAAEAELLGSRGRQKGAPGPFSTEGTVGQKVFFFFMSGDLD